LGRKKRCFEFQSEFERYVQVRKTLGLPPQGLLSLSWIMVTRRIFSRVTIAAAIGAGYTSSPVSAQTPDAATALLEAAEAQASPAQQSVFAIFHASW
jgi:hypothetical protein